uniref:Antitoxin SocA-like Panacea domain-containing protein n=1 Tax=Cyanothece sp. (strain PCC 7425 / ATCC 29141) TaxID=395961 RepID=B8HMZ1_CYAP4
MANLTDVFSYIISQYPKSDHRLTPWRLAKIVYLADWKSAINNGYTMTGVQWKIIGSEPTFDDTSRNKIVEYIAHRNIKLFNFYFFSAKELSESEKRILNFVINIASRKDDQELNQLVCSTYPVITQDEDDSVDLPGLAKVYENEVKPLLRAS